MSGLGELAAPIAAGTVVSLAHPLSADIPQYPHSAFEHTLISRHGDPSPLPGQSERISGAADRISMGMHTGTHLDGLTHVAYDGRTFDGTAVLEEGVQRTDSGVHSVSGASLRPILGSGVLLDFPALLGVDVVPAGYTIDADALERCAAHAGVEVGAGDIVLLRTGWDRLWDDASAYLAPTTPGPDLAGAEWLTSRGITAVGSDTMAFEKTGAGVDPMAVHVQFLVRSGVFILEALDLRELSSLGATRFGFVALPLPVATATGSPVHPVAVVPPGQRP